MINFCSACVEFYVSSRQSVAAGASPITFDTQVLNCNATFHNVTKLVTVFQTGLYWFHFSAGIPNATRTSVRLNGATNKAGIFKNNTAFTNDQSTVDNLQWVLGPSELSLSTDYNLDSGEYQQTAWLGFRLDTIMSPLVAFFVARESPMESQTLPNNTLLNYDKVLVNEGNAWKSLNNTFIAPLAGVYIFSYTTPNNNSKQCKISIFINSFESFQACLCERIHDSVEFSRALAVVSLQANDIVSFHAGLTSVCSDDPFIMSVQGFYYNPISNRQVVWSVNKGLCGNFSGPIAYLSYPVVFTNVGNAWNGNDSKVYINTAGTYFIDLNSYFCGSAFFGDGNLKIQAMLNGQTVIDITIPRIIKDCISRSRSVLYPLKEGDTLWVTIPTSSGGYWSNERGLQSFAGFLLY